MYGDVQGCMDLSGLHGTSFKDSFQLHEDAHEPDISKRRQMGVANEVDSCKNMPISANGELMIHQSKGHASNEYTFLQYNKTLRLLKTPPEDIYNGCEEKEHSGSQTVVQKQSHLVVT